MARLEVGLLPQQPIEMAASFASAAEHLGFGGVWIADSQSVFRDAFLALGAAAMSTRRIALASGVTNPKTRHPAVLACLAGTLAEASNGRMLVGIGVGESAVRNIGERPASVREFEEFVVALRGLLDGEEVGYRGNRLRLSWNAPRVPVYVAASGPRMLRLAGRIGDGVLFQVGARPEAVRYAIDQIAAGQPRQGAIHQRSSCACAWRSSSTRILSTRGMRYVRTPRLRRTHSPGRFRGRSSQTSPRISIACAMVMTTANMATSTPATGIYSPTLSSTQWRSSAKHAKQESGLRNSRPSVSTGSSSRSMSMTCTVGFEISLRRSRT